MVLGPLDVLFELLPADLVAIFKLSVVVTVPLNGVVRKVDERVVDVVALVNFGRGSDIAFFKHVDLHFLSQQHPDSDVELAVID